MHFSTVQVVYELHEVWAIAGGISNYRGALVFTDTPTYSSLVDGVTRICNEHLSLPAPEPLSFTLKVRNSFQSMFSISSASFSWTDGNEVHVLPRFHVATVTISSFITNTKLAIKALCKELGVAGDVSRNSGLSVTLVAKHPDVEALDALLARLRDKGKQLVVNEVIFGVDFGTLQPFVHVHTSGPTRTDGLHSEDDDDDTRSWQSYFSTNKQSRASQQKGDSLLSLLK